MTVRRLAAGQLQHTLRFERRETLRNAYKEEIGAWFQIATLRGLIEPITDKQEYFASLQTQTKISATVTCRYAAALADVTTADRIICNGRTYDIQAVINPEMRNLQLIFAVAEHSVV